MSVNIKRIEKKYDLMVNGMPISNIADTLIEYWNNNMSNYGVHFNSELDLHLKQECQRKFEETHTREEFIALIGQNFLEV